MGNNLKLHLALHDKLQDSECTKPEKQQIQCLASKGPTTAPAQKHECCGLTGQGWVETALVDSKERTFCRLMVSQKNQDCKLENMIQILFHSVCSLKARPHHSDFRELKCPSGSLGYEPSMELHKVRSLVSHKCPHQLFICAFLGQKHALDTQTLQISQLPVEKHRQHSS